MIRHCKKCGLDSEHVVHFGIITYLYDEHGNKLRDIEPHRFESK
jgi:hypothetical protein